MKPYYQDDLVTLYHGDCRDLVGSVDAPVTITDPPYNAKMPYLDHHDSMDHQEYLSWLRGIFGGLSGDTLVFFPGTRNALDVPQVLGTWVFHRMLGWHKKEFAGDLWNGGPAMCWEPIVWARRGEPQFNKMFGTLGRDFLVVPSTHGNPFKGENAHPCPKPRPVMDWLVGLFGAPDRPIFDPFAGTGTTLEAASRAGVPSVGVELSEAYCELVAKRLSQGVLNLVG